MRVETLHWVEAGKHRGHVSMVEQTLLPEQHVDLDVRTVEEMVDAIYRLAVRGAPAIGVAAAYGVLLGIQDAGQRSPDEFLALTKDTSAQLAKSRPTAVNLFWALDRMVARAERDHGAGAATDALIAGLFEEAMGIHASDRQTCRKMGEIGADLLSDGGTVLTHCNAGSLATGGMGNALAPVY